jgi:hypothetical protein
VAEALERGARYDVDYRVIRPSSEVRIVHSRGEVTKDPSGRPRRMFGTVQDITERRRAEQRLLSQYRVTRLLAEAAALEEAQCPNYFRPCARAWLGTWAPSGARTGRRGGYTVWPFGAELPLRRPTLKPPAAP